MAPALLLLQEAAVKNPDLESESERAYFVGDGETGLCETQAQSEGFEWLQDRVRMLL